MKQPLKNILIPFLSSAPVSAIATRLLGTGIPIFTLHRMATDETASRGHSPAFLRQSLEYLKEKGHSFVSLHEVIAALRGEIKLPPKPVAFTIDDGFHDHASIAAPIFLEFDCPVTIFLITGFIDRDIWPWFSQVAYLVENTTADTIELDIPDGKQQFTIADERGRYLAIRSILEAMKQLDDELLPQLIAQLASRTHVDLPSMPPERYRPLTWDSARKLEKQGIRFGPHTVSHPILSNMDDRRSEREIADSWRRIQEELEHPVPIFCYPNGRVCDYGEREIDFVRKAGLIGAVSTTPKQVDLGTHGDMYEYQLPRLVFPESFQDLIQYATWIEHAKNWR